MILSVSNIYKSFNEIPVLAGISFHIEDRDRAAIVGPNGCGKSTLIKIITGNLSSDSGEVALSKDKTIGYLAQDFSSEFIGSIMDVLLNTRCDILELEEELKILSNKISSSSEDDLPALIEAQDRIRHKYELLDGYSYRSRVNGIFKGLGFKDSDRLKDSSSLSGGEKMRLKLGATLLQNPDLIIMDEPTNHLDMNSLVWLENYLKNYNGAVIVVSHDRFFLDRIATKIIELEATHSTVFTGNYTDYASKKEILRIQQMNAYLNQQRDIQHQEEVIKKLQSFNREKSIRRAESRIKKLDKIDKLDKPVNENASMKILLEPCIESGKDVLTISNLTKSYEGNVLFANQSFEIKRGEHVAIIGDNGTGKTTLLKIINGFETADSGSVTLGTKVHIGYYDQEHHVLNDNKTLFDEISDSYPHMTETQIRSTLAAFLFTGDDVYKLIDDLSGGEKGRMSLAKLMLSDANLIILDEPTNHLDITSREILEDALNHYTGTLIYVSHDRYFIDKTAERIIELTGGQFASYVGDYTYYCEKSAELKEKRLVASGNESGSIFTTSSQKGEALPESDKKALDYKAQKAASAQKRKKENELKKCEEEIEKLEQENSELEQKMNTPEVATNSVKLQEITNKHINNSERLDRLYEKWEELSL